jgi:hypothetical protein
MPITSAIRLDLLKPHPDNVRKAQFIAPYMAQDRHQRA